MGKPYDTELSHLPETFHWARTLEIGGLRKAVRDAGSFPLLAIGSGGSLTAAHLLASLQAKYAGRVANATTPLEAVQNPLVRNVSIWLLSANGRNVDILAALASFIDQEPKQLGVICGRPSSPLSTRARNYGFIDLIEFLIPTGKDGFLASNSLLAFSVLIARAYLEEYEGRGLDNTASLEWLSRPSKGLTQLKESAEKLWGRDTVIVLHDSHTRTGAIDLESKFTEAALGHIQIADYRNFAHGRHHWLAKRVNTSGVLALVSPNNQAIAKRTLALLPRRVPVVRVELDGGIAEASVASIFVSLHLTGWAGRARGIDPGRPGVPEFGRRLYNLPFPKARANKQKTLHADDIVAIERKAGISLERLKARGDLLTWQEALAKFKLGLSSSSVAAIIFDYDGTLVDVRDRFSPPTKAIQKELVRLLDADVVIGIATGRGDSVRDDLRKTIPSMLWSRVVIGYYNGAEVAFLDDNKHPEARLHAGEILSELAAALRLQSELREIADQSDREHQITLKPRIGVAENRVWTIANELAQLHGALGVRVVRSSHSIDILAPGVSKQRVLDFVRDSCNCGKDTIALKIGDRGQWPGNDFELLREPNSLSVDEVSNDPTTCWNLTPRGHRSVQATLHYFRSLNIRERAVWLDINRDRS